MSSEENIVGKLSLRYSDKPILQALLQLLPGWGSADTLLQKRADEIRSERLHVFFEEIANGNSELTEELIQTEDFLHAYFCTLRAAINTRRKEKIRLFAKLLDSSIDSALSVSSDEYEELLSILDELSLREFNALVKLMVHEKANPVNEGQNLLQNSKKYWEEFKKDIIQDLGVSLESFNAFMAKIERTGLYTRITGMYYDYAGDIGRTTPLLSRLIALVKIKN